MEVFRYKAFNDNLTNRYAMKFNVVNKKLKSFHINNLKNYGYHMCETIEDTFRYFGAMEIIKSVIFIYEEGVKKIWTV